MTIYQCNLCGIPTPCIKIQNDNLPAPRVCTQRKIPLKKTIALPAKWKQIDTLPEWVK